MQKEHRVMLDTNIVVSAILSSEGAPAEVLELVLDEKIKNFTTEELPLEMEKVLKRPAFGLAEKEVNWIIQILRLQSSIIRLEFNETPVSEDQEDNKFINCALTAKADIITGDNHLLKLKEYRNVKILKAREFLDNIFKKGR